MSLFKKKEEIKIKEEKSCCCGLSSTKTGDGSCCGENVDGICCIKVLGAGCKSCHEQLENVKQAVQNLGLNIEVEYITDMEKIAGYGIMSMPAIIINDKIASVGKVLKVKEVEKLLS